jgi:hypothetical protein
VYTLNDDEKKRFTEGIRAAYAIPFIDDIEDYVLEAVFAYAKGISLPDPLTNIRSKRLFDVVDEAKKIGWSIKALQYAVKPSGAFEVVIQRADIFKKAQKLGFTALNPNSPTEQLGSALLRHWYSLKVNADATLQGVEDKRVCILIKSLRRTSFVYFEDTLVEYDEEDLKWEWTDTTLTGLQGRRRVDNRIVFRWYPNQKQFFETFVLPENAYSFNIVPRRLEANDIVSLLLAKLEGTL